jgi:hypothetical protein
MKGDDFMTIPAMTSSLRLSACVAGALMVGAVSASAAVLDFTDLATFTTRSAASATGTIDGIGFTITGSSANLTYNETSGPGAIGGLAGDIDGIGLGNDEINGLEYITVTFDRAVQLTQVFLLDFFRANTGDAEQATVYSGVPPVAGNVLASFEATEIFTRGGAGLGSFALGATGTVFTFDAGTGNDGIGMGDFALAGLDLALQPAPIPLPAGGLLIGTALAGFGVLRRRR